MSTGEGEATATLIICSNPDCKVAETGKCVEGLELSVCPQYGKDPETGAPSDDAKLEVVRGVALSSARHLDVRGAEHVLRGNPSRVLAFVGPRDSGKTSLMAGLYEIFQTGEARSAKFARSRTFHAFEHACHDSRTESKRNEADMNRTPRGDVQFLHLDLAVDQARCVISFVIADRNGEDYLDAASDISLAENFVEIKRADVLNLLIDGARIGSPERHNLRHDTLMILQALKEGGALTSKTKLAIVLTKVDTIRGAEQEAQALEFFDGLVTTIRTKFSAQFSDTTVFQVAASPKTTTVARGEGVQELLEYWIEAPRAEAASSRTLPPVSDRLFQQLYDH